MNEWMLIVPMAAFALLAAAGWLTAYSTHQVAKKLAGANQQLYAEDADLREACQECRAEIENLRHERDTVQIQLDEALLVPKARPVRVKKVEDAQ